MENLLSLNRVRDYISNNRVIKAKYGVSANVWIVPKRVVIKCFSLKHSKERLECEIAILDKLSNMQVAKCIDRFNYKNYLVAIYEYIDGKVYTNPNINQIESIAKFMKMMHNRLSGVEICKFNRLYDLDNFKKEALLFRDLPFKNEIESICFDSCNDTVIHGDLFPDNAIFLEDRLSGVIDFSDASIGDRYFDIAVTLFSWCRDDISKIEAFLNVYGNIDKTKLKQALDFALLYYIYQRYINSRDWKSLFELREKILNLNL